MFCNAKIEEVESFSLSRHGGDMQLSDNFILREFACKDGSDEVRVHPNLVVMLQMMPGAVKLILSSEETMR